MITPQDFNQAAQSATGELRQSIIDSLDEALIRAAKEEYNGADSVIYVNIGWIPEREDVLYVIDQYESVGWLNVKFKSHRGVGYFEFQLKKRGKR